MKVLDVAKNHMDDAERTFRDLGLGKGEAYGVFSVQEYVDEQIELKQGISHRINKVGQADGMVQVRGTVDAAHALGVQHFIYSSGETVGLAGDEANVEEVERIDREVGDLCASLWPG